MTRPVISDTLQPFRIEGTNIRGRVTRLSTSYECILGTHAYPEPVARILGETIALTAAISTSIKFDGIFYTPMLQIHFQTSSILHVNSQ